MYLSVSPNPDMVNQDVSINMTVAPAPPSGFTFTDIRLEIICPNGTVSQPYGILNSDAQGAVPLFSFTPTEVGIYFLNASFAGHLFNAGSSNQNYLPCSMIQPLLVTDGTVALTLDVQPNPDVINQPATATVVFSFPPPSGEVFTVIKLQVTYPNGSAINQTTTYPSDSAGVVLGSFTPAELGSYVLRAFFDGQNFTSVQFNSAASNNVTLVVTEPEPTPTPGGGGDNGGGGSTSSSSTSTTNTASNPTPTPEPTENPEDEPTYKPTPEPTQRRVFLDGPYALTQLLIIGLVVFLVCLGVMIVLKRWE
jgi:hypothetical protein